MLSSASALFFGKTVDFLAVYYRAGLIQGSGSTSSHSFHSWFKGQDAMPAPVFSDPIHQPSVNGFISIHLNI